MNKKEKFEKMKKYMLGDILEKYAENGTLETKMIDGEIWYHLKEVRE